MLDTSALIGLHEAHPEVTTYLAGVLEQHDDGTAPKTHQVVLGELWTGVLAVGDTDDPDNPRRPVLDTALGLDVATIEPEDAVLFARITQATTRAMSHNDRWICAAAMRTRSTLITQDAEMAEQLGRYFASLELLDALQVYVPIAYIPREPEAVAKSKANDAAQTIRMTDEIKHLLSQLDPREAEVLTLRFGLDRGEPRTLREVADHFELKPSRIAQIEKRALERLRSASE
ncbi:MAG: sigma factor-like helix-turn-helix DNA-binding protein [Actinomycetota bacterium]